MGEYTWRRRAVCAGLLTCLGLGLGLTAQGPSRDETMADSAPQSRVDERAPPPGRREPSASVRSAPPALPPASEESTFDNQVRSISSLRHKGLLSAEERAEQHALLGDAALLEQVARALIAPEDMTPHEDQERRIRLVTFLVEAVAFEDNPNLALAIEKVSQVVMSENYHLESSPWFKRSMAGDKVELLIGLADHQPAAFSTLVERAREGRNAKLVAFAMRYMGAVDQSDAPVESDSDVRIP